MIPPTDLLALEAPPTTGVAAADLVASERRCTACGRWRCWIHFSGRHATHCRPCDRTRARRAYATRRERKESA